MICEGTKKIKKVCDTVPKSLNKEMMLEKKDVTKLVKYSVRKFPMSLLSLVSVHDHDESLEV